jgi:hypothetical protein
MPDVEYCLENEIAEKGGRVAVFAYRLSPGLPQPGQAGRTGQGDHQLTDDYPYFIDDPMVSPALAGWAGDTLARLRLCPASSGKGSPGRARPPILTFSAISK